jgi:hypothetical protein
MPGLRPVATATAGRRRKILGSAVLGSYALFGLVDGISRTCGGCSSPDWVEIVGLTALFGAPAYLGWKHPFGVGVLLICPISFPILFGALLLGGPSGMNLSGFEWTLVVVVLLLPVVCGISFLSAGRAERRQRDGDLVNR